MYQLQRQQTCQALQHLQQDQAQHKVTIFEKEKT
jgi:hypothetical protein